ncbi:Hsp20/alpha crystallin family protein [Pseudomonadota bacterium AL_CKDN230030165-1A_HGKHYDSX7]
MAAPARSRAATGPSAAGAPAAKASGMADAGPPRLKSVATPPFTTHGHEGEFMRSRDFSTWVWGDALALLQHAERMQRQLLRCTEDAHCWEPAVDIIETDTDITVILAVPGVSTDNIVVRFDPDGITISGLRPFPAAYRSRIHRLEIPYGRFTRRIGLSLHALEPVTPQLRDGCLILTLNKLREAP